jgi:dihydrofolate reductase
MGRGCTGRCGRPTSTQQGWRCRVEPRPLQGGGRTIQSFLAQGLVDEMTVSIAPVLIGRGHSLFGDLADDVLLTMRGHHSSEGDDLLRVTYDISRP